MFLNLQNNSYAYDFKFHLEKLDFQFLKVQLSKSTAT